VNGVDQPALYRWLADAALGGAAADALLAGFCTRLATGGPPIVRAFLTLESLAPTVEALGFVWERHAGAAERRAYPRAEDRDFEPEGWLASPLYRLLHSPDTHLRRRLDQPGAVTEFPIFRDLAALGATDYVAVKARFAGAGAGSGVMSTWATDRPGGFTTADLDLLEATLPGLHHAAATVMLHESADAVLGTYLGRDVAHRVLGGAVGRGVAHSLDAILWASDLEGFTRLADSEPQDRVIDLLNAYAERTCDAVEDAGGEVLKFTGDGTLAVFDRHRLADAPGQALRAAVEALAAIHALTAERRAAGLPVSALRVALHRGEVFYGNIGSRTRLDFTVVGPAVNEAARLCDMCKSVDRDLVVSSAFHAAAEQDRHRLVGLGRFALRGVARPQPLYTLDREAS
jgi:adenylate cyclase